MIAIRMATKGETEQADSTQQQLRLMSIESQEGKFKYFGDYLQVIFAALTLVWILSAPIILIWTALQLKRILKIEEKERSEKDDIILEKRLRFFEDYRTT